MDWIPVKDKLPTKEGWVLAWTNAYHSYHRPFIVTFAKGGFWLEGEELTDLVSHWMPLPGKPEGFVDAGCMAEWRNNDQGG